MLVYPNEREGGMMSKVLCITNPTKSDRGWSCVIHLLSIDGTTKRFHSGYFPTKDKLFKYIDSLEVRG